MASRKSDGDRKTNRSSGGLQRSASVKGRRKFTHKYDLVKNGTHMHGWVTHITDPFTFYVRFNALSKSVGLWSAAAEATPIQRWTVRRIADVQHHQARVLNWNVSESHPLGRFS